MEGSQGSPSSSQFCWMRSREPVRGVLADEQSHSHVSSACAGGTVGAQWPLGPPSPSSKEDVCLTWRLAGAWGQVRTLTKQISTGGSCILKRAMPKLKIIFSFITRTYF